MTRYPLGPDDLPVGISSALAGSSKPPADALSDRLLVRVSKTQLASWTLAAELDGCPLSQWVRQRLDAAIVALLGED